MMQLYRTFLCRWRSCMWEPVATATAIYDMLLQAYARPEASMHAGCMHSKPSPGPKRMHRCR